MSHLNKITRRNALKKGGSVVVFGGLAACGGSEQSIQNDSNATTAAGESTSATAASDDLQSALRQPESVATSAASLAIGTTEAKYRFQKNRLFQSLAAATLPNRIPGGSPYAMENRGPNIDYVDLGIGWTWRNRGGDWIDASSTPQGNRPWFSVWTGAVTGSTAKYEYSADVSLALRLVQENRRWCAFLMRSAGAPRVIAGLHQTPLQTNPVPKIVVKYVNGSTATLRCLLIGGISSSSKLPYTTGAKYSLPVVIEFEQPARAVASATLSFTVVEHWSGSNKSIEGFILDPPNDALAPIAGIAARAGLLDGALDQNDSIIGVHRYLDGRPWSDFASLGRPSWVYNTSAERNFDPAIFGTGPEDKTKFPHLDLGKWIGVGSNWTKVDSNYRDKGFAPLVYGLGAVRVDMPAELGVKDGSEVGNAGTLAANAFLFLPEPDFGRLKRIFVRYYLRHAPYLATFARRYQVLQQGVPTWTTMGGKTGIAPSHATSYGGVSASSGGGYGWQMRLSWADCDAGQGGPDENGLALGLHTWDFQWANKPFLYGLTDTPRDTQFGQRDGLGGIVYHNKWYCIEMEVDLNSVMENGPGYLQDGAVRVWVDGSLAFERTQMVMRSLPLYSPPLNDAALRPCRELGHRDLWFNWFHGGRTVNTIDRTLFFTGLAWGREYIGPMKLA